MPGGYTLRAEQEKILEYAGGYMGISAVPGSGKTFTLSHLAAKLVADLNESGSLDEREVLVVTFTNNAVENFQNRIAAVLREQTNLLPGVGYRVRTLHGLAHDIVRERPSLAGLSEEFAIIDDNTANEIIEEIVTAHLRAHPDALAPYIDPDYLRSNRNIDKRLLQDAIEISKAVIRTIKDRRIDLHLLRENLRAQSGTWPLLELGLHAYAGYQRSLDYRGAVDFDDLIVFSLRVLESDETFLTRLQQRWPFVLEDEAQDSSFLQEQLLRKLTAAHGNWVRVGDPNQAINTTFTSANTSYLSTFIRQHKDLSRDLPVSGRSATPIIDTANRLIHWSQSFATDDGAAFLTIPFIQPTVPGDPQPNPPAEESEVFLYEPPGGPLSSAAEIDVVVKSLQRWLPQNMSRTVAVLSPTQARTYSIADALRRAGLPVDDSLLRTGSATRQAATALAALLTYLAQPDSGIALSDAWTQGWWPQKGARLADLGVELDAPVTAVAAAGQVEDLPDEVRTFAAALKQLRKPEDFLFPAQTDWLEVLTWMDDVEDFRTIAEAFRVDVQRWSLATVLPIDELMLTVGNELFAEPANLALTHHLAVLLAKLSRENPDWRLPEFARELRHISQNRRRMPDFSADSEGYEPKPGVVTLATMHGAKGLEWDRVYLTAVNSYGFPGGGEEDQYRGESFYVRDRLNLVAETLEQLNHLEMGTLDEYRPDAATTRARRELAAERLRLFYVGVTRARRELIITHNTGRSPDTNPLPPSAAFQALIQSI